MYSLYYIEEFFLEKKSTNEKKRIKKRVHVQFGVKSKILDATYVDRRPPIIYGLRTQTSNMYVTVLYRH